MHPAGWIVQESCFSDPRLGDGGMAEALERAARWMDPALSDTKGGCLGTYNPDWARSLKDEAWSKRIRVACPAGVDPRSDTCADASVASGPDGAGRRTTSRLISLRNIKGCMGPETSGLAGVMFHETLHATDADNVSIESHNKSWMRGQMEFIRDRVYGTEALCAFAPRDKGRRKWVNILQCLEAVRYRADAPRESLCRGNDFGTSFSDMPMGAVKH